MRFKYIIYPKAEEKLKVLNLQERVQEAKKQEDFPNRPSLLIVLLSRCLDFERL